MDGFRWDARIGLKKTSTPSRAPVDCSLDQRRCNTGLAVRGIDQKARDREYSWREYSRRQDRTGVRTCSTSLNVRMGLDVSRVWFVQSLVRFAGEELM